MLDNWIRKRKTDSNKWKFRCHSLVQCLRLCLGHSACRMSSIDGWNSSIGVCASWITTTRFEGDFWAEGQDFDKVVRWIFLWDLESYHTCNKGGNFWKRWTVHEMTSPVSFKQQKNAEKQHILQARQLRRIIVTDDTVCTMKRVYLKVKKSSLQIYIKMSNIQSSFLSLLVGSSMYGEPLSAIEKAEGRKITQRTE